jgi:protein involved in polysaccharide export with SLBB domain
MKIMKISITASSILMACGLISCTQQKQTQQKVRARDVLELSLINMPEGERQNWNGKYLVNDKGNIRLPLLGSFSVSEMTSEEAAIAIEKVLQDRDIYNNPDVELKIVTEVKPQQTLKDFHDSQS